MEVVDHLGMGRVVLVKRKISFGGCGLVNEGKLNVRAKTGQKGSSARK